MQLHTLSPDKWGVIDSSLQHYPGVGPKPPYPDGELPEGVVRLQWQVWAEPGGGKPGGYEDVPEYFYNEQYTDDSDRRIVAIYTPPTEQEEPQETEDELWEDVYNKMDAIQRDYDSVNYGLVFSEPLVMATTIKELSKQFTITRKP